jgi:lysophospholipase L1-like esterase
MYALHVYAGRDLLDAVRGTRYARAAGGALELSRLSERAIQQADDDGLARAAGTLPGVHLAFETPATVIELVVRVRRHLQTIHPPPGQEAAFVASIDAVDVARVDDFGGDVVLLDPEGGARLTPGDDSVVHLELPPADGPREVLLWLPQNAHTRILSARSDAPLLASPRTPSVRWSHYGSSISHCVTADGPTGVWPVIAARELGWDVCSFALAGQAMLDPFVARAIAERPADLITLKVGINLVNHAAMTARTFVPAVHGFLDILRERQPDTPIVLISPIFSSLHESTPGPLVRLPSGALVGSPQFERAGALTLERVRPLLERIVDRRGDPAISYLNGLDILGEADAHLLVDRLHPDAAGYRILGERFAAIARSRPWGSLE